MYQVNSLALDPVINFGKVTVNGLYDSTALSVALQTDHGGRLPNPTSDGPFNLVWWNASKYADPSDDSNVEIVRCTFKAIDSIIIERPQEGTTASAKNSAGDTYKMILAPTKKMFTDIPADAQSKVNTHASLTTGTHGVGASTIDSVTNRDGAIETHRTTAIHSIDQPPQSHDNTKHSETYITQSAVNTHAATNVSVSIHPNANTHINAAAPHSGHDTPTQRDTAIDTHANITTGIHGINTTNLLSGRTPTFTAWNQNPGNNNDIINQSTGLTTNGTTTANPGAYITYDLGAYYFLAFSAIVSFSGGSVGTNLELQTSFDNSIWTKVAITPSASSQSNFTLGGLGFGRYVRLYLYSAGNNMTITRTSLKVKTTLL